MSECLSSYAVFGSQSDVLTDSCRSRGLALEVFSLFGQSGQHDVLGLSKFNSILRSILGKLTRSKLVDFQSTIRPISHFEPEFSIQSSNPNGAIGAIFDRGAIKAPLPTCRVNN